MGKTQYATATSIDGYIADASGSLDWLFESESSDDSFGEFLDQVGAFAMGATTYEWVLEHEQLLEHPEKWRGWYGDRPAWVFTHRDLPAIPGVTFVQGDVAPVHAAMTAAAGDANLWIAGGGELAGQFADQGLLDEIILDMAPVILGGGAPVLPRRLQPPHLTLQSADQRAQFVHLTYTLTP